MAFARKVNGDKLFMGRLQHGADLLGSITAICQEAGIRLGRVEAIGAVQKAVIEFYNQEKLEYEFITLDQPLEITNLKGNISIKDEQPIVHAHITLADRAGRAFGGHLAPGTIVFACEWIIESFDGPEFVRGLDQQTKLPLWKL